MPKINHRESNHHLKKLVLLGLFIALFLPLSANVWFPGIVQAQSDGVDDAEAQRCLDLGKIYEDAGEWELALEEYRTATRAKSEDLALEARQGIHRVLSRRQSFGSQVKSELNKFWVWAASNSIKLLVTALVFLLLGRLVLQITNKGDGWTVMPFLDLTKNDFGEAVSENIVSLIHEARLTHLNASTGALNVSEEVDLPGFRAPSHKEDLLASLRTLDSLDVSGVGLPMGSALAAVVRWLDMRQQHFLGTIQQRGKSLCLSAQLRNGRTPGSNKVWTACSSIQDGLESILFEPTQDLAFQILFDTREGWGASTPTSLRIFTEALRHLQSSQNYPTVQKRALNDAARLLEEALCVDPGYIAAKYHLAIVYHNLGQYQQAIDTLQSLRLQPDHGLELEIAYNLGAAYYHLLNYWSYDYAEQEFRRVVEGIPDPELSESSRQLCVLSHCGLTSVYAQKMRYDADNSEHYFRLATEHYGKALDIATGDPQITAIAHTAIGMALLNRKQAEEAAAKFEEAVRLKPDYWRAYIHWGRALMASTDFEYAVLCLKQAVALNPSYEFAQYQLGVALKRAKKLNEAVEAFACATGIAQAHDERGYILAEYDNKYEAALSEFERALVLKPDLANAMVNIAWYTLEASYQDDEHLNRALECIRRAVELDQGSPNAWHRHSVLGRVYLAKNQLDDARRELEKAIRLNQKAPQSYFFLAEVWTELGELEKAREALAEFLKQPQESLWYKKTHEVAVALMAKISDQLKANA